MNGFYRWVGECVALLGSLMAFCVLCVRFKRRYSHG